MVRPWHEDAVTQACLTAGSFDDRITALGSAACTFDEKLLNLAGEGVYCYQRRYTVV